MLRIRISLKTKEKQLKAETVNAANLTVLWTQKCLNTVVVLKTEMFLIASTVVSEGRPVIV